MRFFALFFLIGSVFSAQVLDKYIDIDIREGDVVFWDIDHTLIEPLTYEGSEPWFQSLYGAAMTINEEAKSYVIQLYNHFQLKTEVRLTEPSLKDFWPAWKRKGVLMFGLTSRSTTLADRTHTQLQSVGLDFDKTTHQYCAQPILVDNILFTAGGHKGKVLKDFLKENPDLSKKRIIFVDDSIKNIQAVESELSQLDFDVEIYHYEQSAHRYHKISQLHHSHHH